MIPFGPSSTSSSGFWSSRNRGSAIKIPPVAVQDIESSTDRRARTMKHLILANHANHALNNHGPESGNGMPHILGSAYILGATAEHLNDIYENEAKQLEPWQDAPGEITLDEWRDYLGKEEYQRAYVDFFEDQLVRFGYDWKALLSHFLYEGDSPLINNIMSLPLIHLAYAYEFQSRTLAIEALAMGCCGYNFIHKYLDDPSYTKPSKWHDEQPANIIERLRQDARFDDLFSSPGLINAEKLFAAKEDLVLEYWNAWDVKDLQRDFEGIQRLAVSLLVAQRANGYDLHMVPLLTSSHAIRVLFPLIPGEFQIPLIRQWFLCAIVAYLSSRCPLIDVQTIIDFERDDEHWRDPRTGSDQNWKYVKHLALEGEHALDAHYINALRAMKSAEGLWRDEGPGEKQNFFIKAATKFGMEFGGWNKYAVGSDS